MTHPTFLIVGAMKGGTTSLHRYLGEHPQIQMTAIKETNFFAGPPEGVPYIKGEERITRLRDYERLFDPAVAVRGEASPSYTTYPRRKGVPERIRELVPDAKLIYVVRDPVDRLVSHYHHSLAIDGERRGPRDALDDLWDPHCPFTCPGFYALQLEQYLPHFPQEQMLVVDQADLRYHRAETLREIFAFLCVDDSFVSTRFGDEKNTGQELRTYSSAFVLLRRAKTRSSRLWWALPDGLRSSLRTSAHRFLARPLEAPTVDKELRRVLRDLYAEDAGRLRELTGKSFPTWCV